MDGIACIGLIAVIWFCAGPIAMLVLFGRLHKLEDRLEELARLAKIRQPLERHAEHRSPAIVSAADVAVIPPPSVVQRGEPKKIKEPAEAEEITDFAEPAVPEEPLVAVTPPPIPTGIPFDSVTVPPSTPVELPPTIAAAASSTPESISAPPTSEEQRTRIPLQPVSLAATVSPDAPELTGGRPDRTRPIQASPRRTSVEEILAGKWLAYVGALAVMIGAGFGLKYVIDNEWLGPQGRVILGLVAGVLAFAGGAFAMLKEYRFLGQALTGAAMGTLYLSFYAAFHWYQLIPYDWAFVGMVITTAVGLAFSHAFDSQPTAVLGMFGGFLTPAMLPPTAHSLFPLFPYLLLLDIGVLCVSSLRKWSGLQVLVFCGTIFTWCVWYNFNFVPELLLPTLGFLTAFFALFATLSVIHNIVQRRLAEAGDFFLILATPVVYFGALYWMTYEIWPYEQGYFALAMTAIYAVMAIGARQWNPAGKSTTAALAGLAATFLILAPPLSLTGHWVTVAWIAESVLLVELGLRYDLISLSWTGLSLLAKVQIILIIYAIGTMADPIHFQTAFVRQSLHLNAPQEVHVLAWTDLFNNRSYSYLIDMLGMSLLAWEYRRRIVKKVPDDKYGPSQCELEQWLTATVSIVGLFLGLLEIYVWGNLRDWPTTDITSACSIWSSIVALLTVTWGLRVGPRRLESIGWTTYALTIGLLAVCGFGTIAAVTTSAANGVVVSSHWWLWNSRGAGFITALVSLALAAMRYRAQYQSSERNKELHSELPDLSIRGDVVFGSVAYWLGLVTVQLETYVWGAEHAWNIELMLSAATEWTAVFALGLTLWRADWNRTAESNGTPAPTARKFVVSEMVVSIFLMLGLLFAWNALIALAGVVNPKIADTIDAASNSWWFLNARGISFITAIAVSGISAWLFQRDRRSDQTPLALTIGSASYLSALASVLLETLIWCRADGWLATTILSCSIMWIAAFAIGLMVWRVRWGSKSLDELVGFVFLLLFAFLGRHAFGTFGTDLVLRRTGGDPVDEFWLLNPRGFGFLLAILAAAFSAWQYSTLWARRSADERTTANNEDRWSVWYGLSAYWIGLILVLLETTTWGMPRGWLFGTLVSSAAMWTAAFGVGLSAWVATHNCRRLDQYVVTVFLLLGGFIAVAGMAPFEINLGGQAVRSDLTDVDFWLINPRGIGFLLAIAAAIVTSLCYQTIASNSDQSTSATASAKAITTSFGVIAFFGGLILVHIETIVWGLPHGWVFSTLVSSSAMWTSAFASCLAIWIVATNNRQLDGLLIAIFLLLGCQVVGFGLVPFANGLEGYAAGVKIGEYEFWFLNPRGLGYLLTIGAAGLAAALYRRLELASPQPPLVGVATLSQCLGVSAYLVGLAMVTTEAIAQGTSRVWLTGTSLAVTIAWTLYATGTLMAGIYWRAATVRILALSLLMLTIGKVFLIDIWHLETVIRVFAFLSLGAALMLVSFLYRRFRDRIHKWVLPATTAVDVT